MTSKTKLITNDIKDLLTITLKPRHDPIGDQYSRIFMVKVLLVCTMVIGVNQYKDTVSCIIPESLDICGDDQPSCDFIQAACWIQGKGSAYSYHTPQHIHTSSVKKKSTKTRLNFWPLTKIFAD